MKVRVWRKNSITVVAEMVVEDEAESDFFNRLIGEMGSSRTATFRVELREKDGMWVDRRGTAWDMEVIEAMFAEMEKATERLNGEIGPFGHEVPDGANGHDQDAQRGIVHPG
jgi:hypothetical protein